MRAKCTVCGGRVPKGRKVTCTTKCRIKKTAQNRVTRARINARQLNRAKQPKVLGIAAGFFENKPSDIIPEWMRRIIG